MRASSRASVIELSAAALGILAAACTSATVPIPAESEYVLTRVGTAPLPFRFQNETWIADTIRFHEEGGWSRVEVVTLHAEGAPTEPVRRTMEGFVTYQGGRVVLDFECNDVVLRSCIAPDTVEMAGDGLVRRPHRYSAMEPVPPLFRYETVGP